MLELRHLKTLHALRETDSLVEAAERLHLTQSALSHQFKELEERLGLQLFVRKTKPVRFTSAGLRLLQLADSLLPQLRAADSPLPAAPAAAPEVAQDVAEADTEPLWPHASAAEHPRVQGPIVSLDELMAQDAQTHTSPARAPPAAARRARAPSPADTSAPVTPKRRRIVVRRSAPRASPPAPAANPAPHRRSQRRAAQAARAAFQTASDASDAGEPDEADADALSDAPVSDTSV